jgi:hypothetical protein
MMAKEEPKKDEPKPWTPDDPLEDKDDEEEVQRRARANARLQRLQDGYLKPAEPEPGKKKKKLFG